MSSHGKVFIALLRAITGRWFIFIMVGLSGTLISGCLDVTPDKDTNFKETGSISLSQQALSASPDDQCAVATFQGHEYWFCRRDTTWSAARARCQAQGMDLVNIGSSAENEFVLYNMAIDSWIAGTDSASEGNWRWAGTNTQFWSGKFTGSPVGGNYYNWKPFQPDDWFGQDCAAIETFALGQWADRGCTELLDFVCEAPLSPDDEGVTCDTSSGQAGSPWPGFRRCGTHQATTALLGTLEATPVSTYETGADVEGSPAVGFDGTLYVGSEDGDLYAFNTDGSVKWRYSTGGPIHSSPALGLDGTVYVGSNNNQLHAVNSDGSPIWAFTTGASVWSSPAIGPDGTIYLGSDDFRIYAINPDGTQKWSKLTGGPVRSSPAISPDGTIYIGSADFKLYALNSNGTTKWWHLTLGPVFSSPAIAPNGTIYVTTINGELRALRPNTGSLLWSYPGLAPIQSSPAISPDGTVVFGTDFGVVHAVKPDGSSKWFKALNGPVVSSPAIDGSGNVFLGTKGDAVYGLAADDGTELWTVSTGGNVDSSPAIGATGTIYIGADDGLLYAIGGQIDIDVQVSPIQPCVGETVRFDVTATNPALPNQTLEISVDGIATSTYATSYQGPVGERKIAISATGPTGVHRSMMASVNLADCGSPPPDYPHLTADPDPFDTSVVHLIVVNAPVFEDPTVQYHACLVSRIATSLRGVARL